MEKEYYNKTLVNGVSSSDRESPTLSNLGINKEIPIIFYHI